MKTNKKVVLLVGKLSTNPTIYTYPSSFVAGFESAGQEVHAFNLAPVTTLLTRLGWVGSVIANCVINRQLIKKVKKTKPDLVFIIKGIQINAKTLRIIKKIKPGVCIVHFYPDNPFCLWNGNSSVNVLHGLPFTDLFLIWSKQLIPILQSTGCRNVGYFPFAFDHTIYYPGTALTAQEQLFFTSDVVFVGTWDTQREALLTTLVTALPNINLALWGNRWDEYLPAQSPLKKYIRGKAIYKNELLKAFAATKIVLNFIRPQNLQAHNMRTFEVLATGSFLLTQKTDEQSTAPFIEGFNSTCFSDSSDLVKKIAFYINQDSLRKEVALRGLALAQQFTLQAQIQSLLVTIAENS